MMERGREGPRGRPQRPLATDESGVVVVAGKKKLILQSNLFTNELC